jgi:hypothetical protein
MSYLLRHIPVPVVRITSASARLDTFVNESVA